MKITKLGFGATFATAAAIAFATLATSSDAAAGNCGAQICGDNFGVDIIASECKVGAECSVVVKLKAVGDNFHINKDYNHRVTAKGDGVTFLGKEDANVFAKKYGDWKLVNDRESMLSVRFKPTAKGKVTIAGVYNLAVCQEGGCNPSSTNISATVTVK